MSLDQRTRRHAVLTVAEMAAADRLGGPRLADGSYGLMLAAGDAVAKAARERYPAATGFDVLCGPGNNGGDGAVAAQRLAEAGADVAAWTLGEPASDDARRAFAAMHGPRDRLEAFEPKPGRVVVDALFGAGLSRALDGAALMAKSKVERAGVAVLAVDLPSGLAGDTGQPIGEAFAADLTVTFARKKPAHLLHPGRRLCGTIVVADIGLADVVVDEVAPRLFENHPDLWRPAFPWPTDDAHKYSRGHLAVFSGNATATGAARLSAQAGARIGAGAVTLLSPADALAVNAAHLTAIMLRRADSVEDAMAFLAKNRSHAAVLGPGFGDLDRARALSLAVLKHGSSADGAEPENATDLSLVLDADGITAFRDEPEHLFAAAGAKPLRLVVTPHLGEFARLFPDLATDEKLSKVEKARQAACRAGAVVILKGPDTVIAEPAGRAVINSNGTPFLATAGSGDVLAGFCGGLLAQGMPIFEAACAAVWLHAETAGRFGPGLIAEDLPEALPAVLRSVGTDPPSPA